MFDIADIPFSQVKEEEKPKFTNDIKEIGSMQGYKPRSYWVGIPPQFRFKLSLLTACVFRKSTMEFPTRWNITIVRPDIHATHLSSRLNFF
jgi:hypothetical protein